jgi:hypothetical protein
LPGGANAASLLSSNAPLSGVTDSSMVKEIRFEIGSR